VTRDVTWTQLPGGLCRSYADATSYGQSVQERNDDDIEGKPMIAIDH
jgi:hypothetical protein